MAKKIKCNRDIIPVIVEQIDDLNNGRVTPTHAHAVNSSLSRIMYNVNCETRYFRARGEMPDIPFMRPPAAPRTTKPKKGSTKP